MDFDEMFEKYMKNSSVSRHQAQFIWNVAIEKAKVVGVENLDSLVTDNLTIPEYFVKQLTFFPVYISQ